MQFPLGQYNLIENACKYGASESPVQVKLEAHNSQACVEVSNLVSPSDWPDPDKVFDKYYRSPHARRQAGTGLGLYLAKNLMQVLGGNIKYCPQAAQVRFVVSLPLNTAQS